MERDLGFSVGVGVLVFVFCGLFGLGERVLLLVSFLIGLGLWLGLRVFDFFCLTGLGLRLFLASFLLVSSLLSLFVIFILSNTLPLGLEFLALLFNFSIDFLAS